MPLPLWKPHFQKHTRSLRAALERSIFLLARLETKTSGAPRSHVVRPQDSRRKEAPVRLSAVGVQGAATTPPLPRPPSRFPGSPVPVADRCAPHMVLLRHISIALTAAVAALGSALFIALNFFYKRRIWSPQAEYCTIKEVKLPFLPPPPPSSVFISHSTVQVGREGG